MAGGVTRDARRGWGKLSCSIGAELAFEFILGPPEAVADEFNGKRHKLFTGTA